ncbi:DUF5009 domain-containing protein [Paucibacter sp. JuS9]|uniref:DUF5009 domain-containing protein n=1 Tax=Roseateles TaxID=93681 RepID=UPI002FE59A19
MNAVQAKAVRWPAIDLMRGLTVAVMVLVNQWAGVAGLPAWMKHMPADADALSFVDMVFPAFLFIVGMSMPFALQAQLAKAGLSGALRQAAMRVAGLLVLGVFMVNAEMAPAGFASAAWLLAALAACFVLWGSVSGGPALAWPWRLAGVIVLLALASVYPHAEGQWTGLQPHWWGILGLIGWAYGLAALIFLLSPAQARLVVAAAVLPLCLAWFYLLNPSVGGGGHATHLLLVLSGVITALLMHGPQAPSHAARWTLALALALLAAGFALRPWGGISKIYATPAWGLLCAGASALLYLLLQQALLRWPASGKVTGGLREAGQHPLLAYLIPFVLGALTSLIGWDWPAALSEGWAGLLRGGVFLLWVLLLLHLFLRRGLRLRL